MAETAAPAAPAAPAATKESGLEAVEKAKEYFREQRASARGLIKDKEFQKAVELADTDAETDTETAA